MEKPETGREANKALVARFIEEVFNKGNLEVADEIFHPRASSPSAAGLPPGPLGVKIVAGMFRTGMPDFHMDIEFMVAEDDRVLARFRETGTHTGPLLGVPATGRKIDFTEMGILRFEHGKVVESWYEVDMLGLLTQLGVIPSPGQG